MVPASPQPAQPADPARRRGPRIRRGLLAAFSVISLVVGGCARYHIGTRTLYRPDVCSVYVPIFQSETLRRNLGEWLTEAVIKEIHATSSYRVVSRPDADSTLHGRIVAVNKNVLIENINDTPRDIDVAYAIEVTWVDRLGNPLMQRVRVPLDNPLVAIGESEHFVPEGGQSLGTAQQRTIERLAKLVVAEMERGW